MAIDTAERRRSASGVFLPLGPGVTPNSSKDKEWRQQAGYGYSGIGAVGEAIAAPFYLDAYGWWLAGADETQPHIAGADTAAPLLAGAAECSSHLAGADPAHQYLAGAIETQV